MFFETLSFQAVDFLDLLTFSPILTFQKIFDFLAFEPQTSSELLSLRELVLLSRYHMNTCMLISIACICGVNHGSLAQTSQLGRARKSVDSYID